MNTRSWSLTPWLIAAWLLVIVAWSVSATLHAAEPISLVQQFTGAKPEQRIVLVDQLGRRGADSTEAVAVLQTALADPSPEVRWRAARALSSKSAASEEVIATLVGALDDPEPQVRVYAAYALGKVARGNALAAQALARHVNDESSAVQRESINALRSLDVGPELIRPVIATALASNNPAVVASAARIMASLGEAAIDDVRAALQNEQTRYWACLVIQELGPVASETVNPLRAVLQSDHAEERLEAALALAAIGPPAATAAEDLAGLLRSDPQASVQLAAAYALGKLEIAQVADEALTAATTSQNGTLRLVSAWALHRIYPEDQPYASATAKLILAGIQSEDPQLRAMAARTLAESNIPLDKAAPYIAAALKYRDPLVVEQAVKAILEQGEQSLPALKEGLGDAELQLSALKLIQRLGPQAAGLVEEVRALVAAEDPAVRREALFTLAALGEAANTSADDVSKAFLAGTTREDRLAAIYAAGRLGSSAKALLPALQQLAAETDDQQMQVAALWAISRIAPEDEQAVDQAIAAMVSALDTTNRDSVKIAMANSLGELGSRANSAVPTLEELQQDSNPRVQQAAKQALEKIEQPQPLP